MTKILSIPSSINEIEETVNLVDGFILSIDGLSVNSSFYVKINDIETVVSKLRQNNKKVFISLNKNIFNSDLEFLEDTLLKLNNIDIDGVFYYDISVLSLVKKLKLNINLIWSQEHLTTNYLTCNYYHEKGAKGVYLSSEITLNEILEIKEKTNLEIFVSIFGYLPMFDSKRHVVKNYLDSFNLKDNSKIFKLEKEGNEYLAVDEKQGTTVYSSNILNGLEEYLLLNEKNIDYVVLNSFNIESDKYKKVLECFKNIKNETKEQYNREINDMFAHTDKGFFYKETIYRVKKDEKRSN